MRPHRVFIGMALALPLLPPSARAQQPEQLYATFYAEYQRLPVESIRGCRIPDRSPYMTAYENLYAYTILTGDSTFDKAKGWLRDVLLERCRNAGVAGSGFTPQVGYGKMPPASATVPAGVTVQLHASGEALARIEELERELQSARSRVGDLEFQLQSTQARIDGAVRQEEEAQVLVQHLLLREQASKARPDGCWLLVKDGESAGEPAVLCLAADPESGESIAWAVTDDEALLLGARISVSGGSADVQFENSGRIGVTVDQTGMYATGSWTGSRMISFQAIRILSGT